jgi:rhomboid family GlyGly-CTERM serine protease
VSLPAREPNPRGQGRGSGRTIESAAPLFVLLCVVLALGLLPEEWRAGLAWARTALADGEPWRPVTGHLVHFGVMHLTMNAGGLALIAVVLGREFGPLEWVVLLAFSLAAVDLGLALASWPDAYRGLSGVLHALLAAPLAARVVARRDRLAGGLLLLLWGKVIVEVLHGPNPATAALVGVEIATVAHVAGTAAGSAWSVVRVPRLMAR